MKTKEIFCASCRESYYYAIGLNCCNFILGTLFYLKLFWETRPIDISCFAQDSLFFSSTFQLCVVLGHFKTEPLTPNTPTRSLSVNAQPPSTLQNTSTRSCDDPLRSSGGAEHVFILLPRMQAIAAPDSSRTPLGQGFSVPPPKPGHNAPSKAVLCVITLLFTRLDITSDNNFLV